MTEKIWFVVEIAASLFDSILFVYFIIRYNYASLKTSKLTIPTVILLFSVTLVGDFLAPEIVNKLTVKEDFECCSFTACF